MRCIGQRELGDQKDLGMLCIDWLHDSKFAFNDDLLRVIEITI